MNFLRLIARVIGRLLDSCQSGFLVVDFVFFLVVEIGVNSQIPWAKHIRLLKSDNSVKARTPPLGYVGLHTVIEWIMVAHVYSSDCRYRCIGKIIAKDLRLVASRLYQQVLPGPGHVTCRAVTCGRIITWSMFNFVTLECCLRKDITQRIKCLRIAR